MADAPPPPTAPPGGGEEGTGERFNLWFVGVLIMSLGTCCQALGANLQQWSVRQEARNSSPENKRPARRQPCFMLGVGLLMSAGIVSAIALVFSAQSLIAPLILLIFIVNPLVAHYMNREPFAWKTDGMLTVLVAASIGVVLAFAPHHSASHDGDYMKWLFEQPSFFVFISVVTSIIASAYIVKRRAFYRASRDWNKLDNLVDRGIVHLSFGVLGGAFGGLNITLTKATFTLIIDTFDEGASDGGFFAGLGTLFSSSWLLYVLGFSLLLTFLMELKCTIDGLQFSSAMIVVSTLAVVEEVVATMGALLYFQDYNYFDSTMKAVVFALANLAAVIGVITMASLRLRHQMAVHVVPGSAPASEDPARTRPRRARPRDGRVEAC